MIIVARGGRSNRKILACLNTDFSEQFSKDSAHKQKLDSSCETISNQPVTFVFPLFNLTKADQTKIYRFKEQIIIVSVGQDISFTLPVLLSYLSL